MHDPADHAEATVVLAALAALGGLLVTGEPMPGRCGDAAAYDAGRPATLRAIARETGLALHSVRQGLGHLADAGHVQRLRDGWLVQAEHLRARAQSPSRCRIVLGRGVRSLGLRARPLLLAGFVAAHVNPRGELRLGLTRIGNRLGIKRRSLQRSLAEATAAGALRRWIAPVGAGLLILAPGPCESGALGACESGALGDGDGRREAEVTSAACESGAGSVRKRRTPRANPAHPPCESGARTSGVLGVQQKDSAGRADARSEAETEARSVVGTQQRPKPAPDRQQAIERWALDVTRHLERSGQNQLDPDDPRHVAAVAGLLDQLGPAPEIPADGSRAARDRRAAFRAEQLDLARRALRWCPDPERLGRWLVRAVRWFRVRNVGAYLRKACERGDPGTLLESHTKNRCGRAAETWRDFGPATERALVGEHAADVRRIVEGGAAVLSTIDAAKREELREQLRQMLAVGRRAAARAVLLQLVGPRPSDVVLMSAVDGVLTLQDARQLLAA